MDGPTDGMEQRNSSESEAGRERSYYQALQDYYQTLHDYHT